MLEEYYSRLAILNKNPDLLKDKPEEQKTKLKSALNKISEGMDASDDDLEKAMAEFIKVFDELGLQEDTSTGKTRSLSLKKGTNLPRQLINDVTIMTLKNF
ncbi:hypothetical protein [[Eubacterium] cellulosolvens]